MKKQQSNEVKAEKKTSKIVSRIIKIFILAIAAYIIGYAVFVFLNV